MRYNDKRIFTRTILVTTNQYLERTQSFCEITEIENIFKIKIRKKLKEDIVQMCL